ncbi:MAG: hypothetical protein ABJE95_34295 [Byssovorax sp.]
MAIRNQFGALCFGAVVAITGLAGCGGDGVGSNADAEAAYKGLDSSIDQAIQLGFDGFNAASSANIPPQTGKGTSTGTMTISGKVDQGSSSNKTMSLTEALAMYSNDGKLTYDTGASALPTIDMKLSKIPTGTVDGTIGGAYTISGDLKGAITLTLSFSGSLQASASDPTKVERKPGTTHITGTAASDYGTFDVDITR